MKFYAAQRLDIRRIETLKQGETATGIKCRVKVVKNKVANPATTAELRITFGEGISYEDCLIDIGLEEGTIKQSGAHYRIGEEKAHGRENLRLLLIEKPQLLTATPNA